VPQQIALPLIALAIGATFACCALMVNATSVVRLHQSARALPSAVVLLTALAATLACSRIPAKQYASLAVAAAALAAAAIGSTAFLDRFGRDPFLVRAEAMEWRTLSDRPESEFAIPFPVSHLRLSPSGRHVAVVPVDRTMGADEPMPFHVGPAGGDLTPIEADDLIFLDDERALVLQSTPEGAELRVMRTGESRDVEWRQRVPGIVGSSLAFRESTKKWRLLGWDRSHGLVRVEGHVGREGLEWTRWAASEVHNGWIDAIAASGPSALVVETRYDPGLLTGTTAWAWGLLIPQQIMESRFWTLAAGGRSDHGTSRLETHCIGATMDDERLVCSAFDGTDTRLIALDPGTGAVSPLGSLPGRFAGATLTGAGWLTGWADSTVVALHPATRQALRVTGRQGYVASMAVTSQVIGTAAYDRGATMTVRLYGIEQVRRKPRATPQGRSAQNLGTQ
jgi:hypothetical protein